MKIHLIANAHLDPVWLWDWREGLNEGIQTCRTVLDLMDEFPDLTFIRGEAAIYEHIERFAPEVFARITAMIEAGRWDVVGGSYIQPDTNLTGEATLRKHFERGLGYFQSHLGVRPTVALGCRLFRPQRWITQHSGRCRHAGFCLHATL
jgi:alpha-mannosidase